MRHGRLYVSTGFYKDRSGGWSHHLIALHRKWRFAYVTPDAYPTYRRLYIGPIEFEWSVPTLSTKGYDDDLL